MLLALLGSVFPTGAAAQRKSFNYEQFGAVGDGVHDDMDAIVATHAAANEAGVPVKLTGGKIYYIGNFAKTAVIRTDVDFADSRFIIDDVGRHDFGYQCRLPRSVVIDGLLIDDTAVNSGSYAGPAVFGTFSRDVSEPDLLPYPIPETLYVRNVSVGS